jgi:protein-L-isoaspartate(D-aspartate) O-methyltransferase
MSKEAGVPAMTLELENRCADRATMVERQIARRGVSDPLVLAAMRVVPREAFVLPSLAEFAYEDTPLPIEGGQTISQPYIVAHMLELAELGPRDRVLEIGAGSGYAAAVMSRIVAHVFAIERHAILANNAQHRLAELGYRNVTVYHRDGSGGLPEAAPFDAIIVSAGGTEVPQALCSQLAIGGRLIIPVGSRGHQVLKRIVRKGEEQFEEEDQGLVAFVPLVIGQRAEGEDSATVPQEEAHLDSAALLHTISGVGPIALRQAPTQTPITLPARIAQAALPFGDYDELSRIVDRYAGRKVVLLGEATHGTSEFYQARAWITERLVALHGFTIVAVEADWPDATAYDAYVRGRSFSQPGEPPFSRFPRWMWRNRETYEFLHRLRAANENKPDRATWAGFYGLDIYSLGASVDAVLAYLERVDPHAARVARERYGCLTPWRAEPARYGRMALGATFTRCEPEVVAVLRDLLDKRLSYVARDGEAFFDARQNARIVEQAERYYRTIYYGSAASWNVRDQHMFETLEGLLAHRGPEAKAVVWAHNSHVGDASFTDMGRVRGEHNIGQLCRQKWGAEAALVGFSTDRGKVAAASEWGGEMEIKSVRPARRGSFEAHCRESEVPRFFLDLGVQQADALRAELVQPMHQRAIGVIYRPESEFAAHYFEAEPAQQFDAWVWFEETRAVSASSEQAEAGEAETFPFGV